MRISVNVKAVEVRMFVKQGGYMLNNKWIIAIIVVAIIVGLLIVTKANFGGHVGMAGTGASIQVGPTDK